MADLKHPTQQQPKDQSSEVAALKAQVDRLEQMLMQQIATAPKMTPDTLWAQNHEREVKIQGELDRQAALFLETVQARTQWESNRQNLEGKRLFRVQVGWCPEVIVRANDDVAAKAYYDKICGIRGVMVNHGDPTKTTYSIADVTADQEAQKAINSQWQYQAAA